ncbi:MAG: DUF255 domain-containing protein [Alphaproteobacteria bacterium]|nr:DUF255 domain-containing protein [Alphaproteobacteria bacterium]
MPNRLAHETSPYLLQHQHNPVDWYPWGAEALDRARAEHRPILLSIGYSACHWCHVMERESFEDAATATVMNQHFVCIKVDREERPDLDELYMKAVQAFTGGHGGWPMTVFLTPDGAPFLGGTYFPPVPSRGMPSFRQVMDHAVELFGNEAGLRQVTAELSRYLRGSGRLPAPAADVGEADLWLSTVAAAAADEFDEVHAGFGDAPKFPPHGTLAVLLAHHHRTGDADSLRMATATLDAMARGGMYDLLAGGFARYSVDEQWRVPHFEKMLYDNAQLLPLYADAWVLTGHARYERVVRETVGWLLSELRDPCGAFWSALDADSEGEEGRFYAWTPAGLREAVEEELSAEEVARLLVLLDVTAAGTFEHGTSVLRRPVEASAADEALLARALPLLYAAREDRVRPGLDDKVLTSWNALAISALARCAAIFDEPGWYAAAGEAAAFLLETQTVDGRLRRTGKDGRPGHILAYADDHAFLVQALVDLFEAGCDESWLRDAVALCDQLIALFWDETEGGLFFTGHDGEPLLARSKHMLGGAEPSANGVAALAMARLAELTGRDDLRARAEVIVRSYRPLLERAPRALGPEALAAAWLTGRTAELGIVGALDDPDTAALLEARRRRFLPFVVTAVVPPDAGPDLLALLPWMAERVRPGAATAFLCEGATCQLPARTADALGRQLDGIGRPPARQERRTVRDHAPALPADADAWLGPLGADGQAARTLDTLRGKVVVLDFWTSCCINCLHLLPELHAVEERFAGRPVEVIGVHSAKFDAEKGRAFLADAMARHHVVHPVVADPDHTIWQAYAVRGWPTVVVLDAEGRIAWRKSGELDRAELGAVVQRLLDEGAAAGTLAADSAPLALPAASPGALRHPGGIAVWPDPVDQVRGADALAGAGRLYLSDSGNHQVVEYALERGLEGWPRLRELRRFGSGSPGLLDARGPLARFQDPQGLARAGDHLWVADTGNHAVRRIDLTTGAVQTMAGTGQKGGPSGGGPARQTALRSPWDVAVAPPGSGLADGEAVFVAMAGSHQLWVLLGDSTGPFVGSGREDHVDGQAQEAALAQPSGLSLAGRYLFWVDSETSSVRALDLADHSVGTLLGRGLFDFGDVDGPASGARMQHPLGITLAGDALYVADTYNHKVKRVDLQGGGVSTVAGDLSAPGALSAAGDFLLVADTGHHRVVAIQRHSGEQRVLVAG